MSKATASTEFPPLAERHGFRLAASRKSTVAYAHDDRREAFTLSTDDDGAFLEATWLAATEWIIVVDKRKPGEFSGHSGLSLTSTSSRRAVGMDEVRPELRTSRYGLPVGYNELKKRIRNVDWRVK